MSLIQLYSLEKRGISDTLISLIQCYFKDKVIIANNVEIEVTCGVPQRLVLGPTLCNIFYDNILGLKISVGARLIAYADDLAIVIVDKTEEELMKIANHSLNKVQKWM